MAKKVKFDILKCFLDMKESNESYNLWLQELEVPAEKRGTRLYQGSKFEHPL